jgi:hypothetical protein
MPLVTQNPAQKAVTKLIESKLGSYAKAVLLRKTHFAEYYYHFSNLPFDGHKEGAYFHQLVNAAIDASSKPTFEEIVICINEKDPIDLVDEIGISREEILEAINK